MKKLAKTGINIEDKGGIILRDIVHLNNEREPKKRKNKKKLIIVISLGVILAIVLITILVYYSSRDARNFLDTYLFRKNVTQEKLNSIDLDYDSNTSVFAYNKYICILAENKLMEYNTSGNLENEISLEINNPVYSVNNRYIAISEKNGNTLNLISGSEILWTNQVDGKISKINVNNNWYVSIIVTGTTNISVIVTFDNKGNELFKTYLSRTIAVDTSISNDNKYLAFAEVNTTGTTIQSYVKVVEIEKTKQNASESIINTYVADNNKLILNIKYTDNNKIVCQYDNEITLLENETNTLLLSLNENGKNINFANINLDGYAYRAVGENDGLFNTNTVIEMRNVNSDKTTVHTVEGTAKYIYSFNNIIAVNLGQAIEFFNTNGWLLKNYSSTQEVQNIVIGNGIAGIIYKDRVEILNL